MILDPTKTYIYIDIIHQMIRRFKIRGEIRSQDGETLFIITDHTTLPHNLSIHSYTRVATKYEYCIKFSSGQEAIVIDDKERVYKTLKNMFRERIYKEPKHFIVEYLINRYKKMKEVAITLMENKDNNIVQYADRN